MKKSGFTLTEMMIVVAIVAILSSISVPNFQVLMASSALKSAANNFTNFINTAKLEAGKRGVRVTICGSNDGTSCSSNALTSTSTLLMFVDNLATGGKIDSGEEMIKTMSNFSDSSTLKGAAATRWSALTFGPTGFPIAANGGAPNACLQFNYLDSAQYVRSLVMDRAGRLRQYQSACA